MRDETVTHITKRVALHLKYNPLILHHTVNMTAAKLTVTVETEELFKE